MSVHLRSDEDRAEMSIHFKRDSVPGVAFSRNILPPDKCRRCQHQHQEKAELHVPPPPLRGGDELGACAPAAQWIAACLPVDFCSSRNYHFFNCLPCYLISLSLLSRSGGAKLVGNNQGLGTRAP